MRHVSSAIGDCLRICSPKESAMVHITVLKMTPEMGSPWYTVFRGIGWDVQLG